jgi:protein SCO1
MNRRAFVAIAGGAVAVSPLLPSFQSSGSAFRPQSVTPAERRRRAFPNVTLRTHEGDEVRFYDDLLKDKTVLLHMMYTRCQDGFCIPNVANLARIEKALGNRVGRDVFFYSITLDPRHDTPAVLKKFAGHFTQNPGWLFLTADRPQTIEALRRRLGYVRQDPAADREPKRHVGHLQMGIEPLERWCTVPSALRPELIANYLRWMEPNGVRPKPWMLVKGRYGSSTA